MSLRHVFSYLGLAQIAYELVLWFDLLFYLLRVSPPSLYKRSASLLAGKSAVARNISEKLPLQLDHVLFHSAVLASPILDEFFNGSQACHTVLCSFIAEKKKLAPREKARLALLLEKIHRPYKLCALLAPLCHTPVDTASPEHARLLAILWGTLTRREVPKMPSPEWKEIGFQGTNPQTDFRGSGLLGLKNLASLARNYPQEIEYIFCLSTTPEHYFPLAIVGLDISFFLHAELQARRLNRWLIPRKIRFIDIYLQTFTCFCRLWLGKTPKTLLDTTAVMERTRQTMRRRFHLH